MKNIMPMLLRLIAAGLCSRMKDAIETSTKCIASAMAASIAESEFEAIRALDERRTGEGKAICSQ
jgi:hypothetical protein